MKNIAISKLFSFLIIIVLGVGKSYAADPPLLHLPWAFGDKYMCTQGNGGDYSHNGTTTKYSLDFGLSSGTPVKASADGTAYSYDGSNGPWGKYVKVDHGNGYYTIYAHLSSFGVGSRTFIRLGDVIGLSGNTGTKTTGAHLHTGLYTGDASTETVGTSVPATYYILLDNPSEYVRGYYRESGNFFCDLVRGYFYRSGTVAEKQCARINSRFTICWMPYVDSSCKMGKNWELYDYDTASTIRLSNNSYCPSDGELVSLNGPTSVGIGGDTGDDTGGGTLTPLL